MGEKTALGNQVINKESSSLILLFFVIYVILFLITRGRARERTFCHQPIYSPNLQMLNWLGMKLGTRNSIQVLLCISDSNPIIEVTITASQGLYQWEAIVSSQSEEAKPTLGCEMCASLPARPNVCLWKFYLMFLFSLKSFNQILKFLQKTDTNPGKNGNKHVQRDLSSAGSFVKNLNQPSGTQSGPLRLWGLSY